MKYGKHIVLRAVGLLLLSSAGAWCQAVEARDVLELARSWISRVDGIEVEYEVSLKNTPETERYHKALNEISDLVGDKRGRLEPGYVQRRPYEQHDHTILVFVPGKRWSEVEFLMEEEGGRKSQFGYNGSLWYQYDVARKSACVSERELRAEWPDYVDFVRCLHSLPQGFPRSETTLVEALERALAEGALQAHHTKEGMLEVVTYQSWTKDDPSQQWSARYLWNPREKNRLESIEIFQIKKEEEVFTNFVPYSTVRFSQFDDVPGRMALPMRIDVEAFSRVTKSRDAQKLMSNGDYLFPVDAFLNRTFEFSVSRVTVAPPERLSAFEPVFPPGTNLYDERTGMSYAVGDEKR